MGFQGIKNQGADPLQLFLAIRQLRQQEEQTKQDQALARVKAMQEARAFAREDEKFRMDMAIKAADLQAKQQGNAPAVADAIDNANAEFTPADLSIAGGGEESRAFGAIVADADPAGLQRGINAQAALDSALRPAVQAGRSVESLYGEAEAARRASSRARATEAATKDQDAERTFDISERKATQQEGRLARRVSRQIIETTNEISKLEDQIAGMEFGTKRRGRAQRQLRALEARLLRLTDEGLPESVAEAKKFLVQDVALGQQVDRTVADLAAIRQYVDDQGPDFLGGIQGGGRELFALVPESIRDISSLLGANVVDDLEKNSGLLSDNQMRQLRKQMAINDDGTLQRVTDIKALSARIAYIVTRAQNPGRFSNEQYRDSLDRYRLDAGTSEKAYRNLNTAIADLRAIGADTRNRVLMYNRVLGNSPSGGLMDGSTGQEVLPGAQPTGFSGFNDPPSIPKAPEPSQMDDRPFTDLEPEEKESRVDEILRRNGLR